MMNEKAILASILVPEDRPAIGAAHCLRLAHNSPMVLQRSIVRTNGNRVQAVKIAETRAPTYTSARTEVLYTMDVNGPMGDRAYPKGQHEHVQHSDVADESPIQMLPNELLIRLLPEPWIAALVCSRWYEMVGALSAIGAVSSTNSRVLCASSILELWGRRPPDEIHAILYSVISDATLAHLLPLLIASDRPANVDYVLKLWSDENRPITETEAAQWIAAHRQLDPRFNASWPKHIPSRAGLDCNHGPHDVRAIAFCVMLSTVALHTQSPRVLREIAALCPNGDSALRKAALVAVTRDRHNVLGALLYLYAQHIHGDDARCRPDKSVAYASQHNAVIDTFKAIYVVAGTYGSLECAHIADLFLFCVSVTPSMIMSPAWSDHMRCKLCDTAVGARKNRLQCALGTIGCIMLHCATMRTTHWLRAAIAADRPEMLGPYMGVDGNTELGPILGDVARLGKTHFCEAVLSASPNTNAATLCGSIDAVSNDMPFTIEGMRWLASQAWYTPRGEYTIHRILDNLFCVRDFTVRGIGTVADDTARLHNTVEALGLIAGRWPALLRGALARERHWVSLILVACVLHKGDSHAGGDLFAVVAGYLNLCGVFPHPGSPIVGAWSYLIDAGRSRNAKAHCALCACASLESVFARIVEQHQDALCGDDICPLDRDLNSGIQTCKP